MCGAHLCESSYYVELFTNLRVPQIRRNLSLVTRGEGVHERSRLLSALSCQWMPSISRTSQAENISCGKSKEI